MQRAHAPQLPTVSMLGLRRVTFSSGIRFGEFSTGRTGTRSGNVFMVTPQCTPSLTHWVGMRSITWILTCSLYMMSCATSGFRVLFCTHPSEVLTGGTGTRLPTHTLVNAISAGSRTYPDILSPCWSPTPVFRSPFPRGDICPSGKSCC